MSVTFRRIAVLVCFVVAVLSGAARAQRHISVLWLGNSYICDNATGIHLDEAVERFVSTAYDSGLTDLVIDTQAVSCLWAMGLAAHFSDSAAMDMVRSGTFTHVVLQGYILSSDTTAMRTSAEVNLEYAGLLADEVRLAGGEPIVWCAHPRCDATPYMWDYVIDAYREAADSSSSAFAPVSIAWRRSREEKPGLELYQGDCIHQNANGIYLNAAMFYSVFTGSTVVGNPARSVGPTIPDSTALFLQQQAWAVYDSVVNGTVQPVRPRAAHAVPAAAQPAVSLRITPRGVRFLEETQAGSSAYLLDGRNARQAFSHPIRR